ncbi:3-ketoacyl-CoA thiolase 2, peroxisomal [Tanacetum coccineum]
MVLNRRCLLGVALTGDEDPTDEDGDIGIDRGKTAGRAIITRGGGMLQLISVSEGTIVSREVLHLFRILNHVVIEKTNINPAEVGDIVVGSVLESGSQRASECRMATFYAAYPQTVPVRVVNRQYSSGLQFKDGKLTKAYDLPASYLPKFLGGMCNFADQDGFEGKIVAYAKPHFNPLRRCDTSNESYSKANDIASQKAMRSFAHLRLTPILKEASIEFFTLT